MAQVPATVAAITAHMADAEVVKQGLLLLGNLAVSDANDAALVAQAPLAVTCRFVLCSSPCAPRAMVRHQRTHVGAP